MGNIVYHFDSVELADLLTHLTSDTSHGAYRHDILTFVPGAALYKMLLLVRNKLDQMARTYGDTFAAGLAGILVYYSHTVHYMDGVKGTGLHAGALSETAESTGLRASVLHHIDHDTVV